MAMAVQEKKADLDVAAKKLRPLLERGVKAMWDVGEYLASLQLTDGEFRSLGHKLSRSQHTLQAYRDVAVKFQPELRPHNYLDLAFGVFLALVKVDNEEWRLKWLADPPTPTAAEALRAVRAYRNTPGHGRVQGRDSKQVVVSVAGKHVVLDISITESGSGSLSLEGVREVGGEPADEDGTYLIRIKAL